METIYKVSTEGDCEGRSRKTIAYAMGDQEVIKSFYDKEKNFTLYLEEIKVHVITPESIAIREALIERKKELEMELENIKNRLK
jgi:hypothetical protein